MVVCIIGGESEALGFHQETTEESRKQQDRFCIQTLHYIFHEITFVILLYGSTNVIRTKHFFSTQVKYYKFHFEIQKRYIIFNSRKPFLNAKILNPNTTFQPEEIATNFSYKFKTIDVILMCLEILLHKHKAVIKAPETVKQTVNRK